MNIRMTYVNTKLILFSMFFIGCGFKSMESENFLVPTTVTENSSLPSYLLTDGTKLHLETFGSNTNPVLIVLHGGPGADYRSYLNLQELKDKFYVVFWDQRGAGLSQRVPESQLNGPQYLKDLEELVNHFAPGKSVILLGHSWGGAYATYYVQNHPDRVDKLILLEPGAFTPEAAKAGNTSSFGIFDAGISKYLLATEAISFKTYAKQDYLFNINIMNSDDSADFANANEKNAIKFWRFGFLACYGINNWQGNFTTPTFNASTGLERYTGKTLLLAGSASKRIGYDFQDKYHKSYFKNLQFKKIEGAGHYMITFNSSVVIPIIREFLQ